MDPTCQRGEDHTFRANKASAGACGRFDRRGGGSFAGADARDGGGADRSRPDLAGTVETARRSNIVGSHRIGWGRTWYYPNELKNPGAAVERCDKALKIDPRGAIAWHNKVCATIREDATYLGRAEDDLGQPVEEIERVLQRRARRDQRKQLGTFEILNDPSLLGYES